MGAQVQDAYRDEAAVALRRASNELRKTIVMVEDLEQVVGLAIALAGQAGADQMLELQKLDHIQQKILGVSDFLDALGLGDASGVDGERQGRGALRVARRTRGPTGR